MRVLELEVADAIVEIVESVGSQSAISTFSQRFAEGGPETLLRNGVETHAFAPVEQWKLRAADDFSAEPLHRPNIFAIRARRSLLRARAE